MTVLYIKHSDTQELLRYRVLLTRFQYSYVLRHFTPSSTQCVKHPHTTTIVGLLIIIQTFANLKILSDSYNNQIMTVQKIKRVNIVYRRYDNTQWFSYLEKTSGVDRAERAYNPTSLNNSRRKQIRTNNLDACVFKTNAISLAFVFKNTNSVKKHTYSFQCK